MLMITSQKIKNLVLFVIIFVGLSFSPHAYTATYYVDATGGVDSNNGTNPVTAFQTLTKVNSLTLTAGDQVLFKRGEVFMGALSIFNKQGTNGNRIVYGAYGTGASPIIDGHGNGQAYTVYISGSTSYTTIQDVAVRGGSVEQFYIFSGTFNNLLFSGIDVASTTAFMINGLATTTNTTFSNINIHNTTGVAYMNNNKAINDTFTNITSTGSMQIDQSGAATSTINMTNITATGFYFRKLSNSSFDNITLTNGGININVGLENTTFSNITQSGSTGHGFDFDSGYFNNISITNATTTNNALDGINFGAVSATVGSTTVTNLYSANNINEGFDWKGSGSNSTLVITNSIFENNGNEENLHNGLSISGAGYATTTNATARYNSNDGFNIKGSVNAVFDNNISYYNGTAGQEISGSGDGYSWHDTSTGVLKNSYIQDNLKGGVTNIDSTNVTVYNNIFYQSSSTPSSGMTSFDNSAIGYIYNNTYYNPTQEGTSTIYKSTSSGEFKNNIILGFKIGIDKITSGSFSSDYNIISGAGTAAVSGAGFSLGTNSTTTNPQFVNAVGGNYALTASSFAINGGLDSVCPLTDRIGTARQGICDIGAYEYIDTIAPVITINGNGQYSVAQNVGQSFVDPGAIAIDDVDGNVGVVVSGDIVDNSVARTYVITYNAVDSAGNAATQVLRTVNILSSTDSVGGGGAPSPQPKVPDSGWQIHATSTASSAVGLTLNFGDDIKYFWISESHNGIPSTKVKATSSIEWSQPKLGILYIRFCNGFDQCTDLIRTDLVPKVFTSSPAPVQTNEPAISTSARYIFPRNLKLGMTGKDVTELQKYLNSHGFIISKKGPGSQGNETNYFGIFTKFALVKFQEAHTSNILAPAGLTKGNGYFGPSTRAFINRK